MFKTSVKLARKIHYLKSRTIVANKVLELIQTERQEEKKKFTLK